MNLSWLKYVSYACVAGAFFFYSVIRLRKFPSIIPVVKLMAFVACVVVACAAWHVQESNADQHSPRLLAIGTVTSINVSTNRGGSIDDEFQLGLGGGRLSPKFSTDEVADSQTKQPIHVGDTLGVLYRTWDDVPLTIDELEGQHSGWHYRRYQPFDPYVWSVGIVGFSMFIGLLVLTARRSTSTPPPETIPGYGG